MRNILNFFILIILFFPINTFCQNINSYNIEAKLNSEDKTLTVSQIMKFKNTSNVSLNNIEVYLYKIYNIFESLSPVIYIYDNTYIVDLYNKLNYHALNNLNIINLFTLNDFK